MKRISKNWEEALLKPTSTRGLEEFYRELEEEGRIYPSDYAESHPKSYRTYSGYGKKLERIGLSEKEESISGGAGNEAPIRKVYYRLTPLAKKVSADDFTNLASLTPNMFEILNHLKLEDEAGEEVCWSIAPLTQATGQAKSTVARSLKKLEERDYLTSHSTSKNSSAIVYELTEEGEEVLENHPGAIRLDRMEESYLEVLKEERELKVSELQERVGCATPLRLMEGNLDELTEKGELELVEKIAGKDSDSVYRITAAGERILEDVTLTEAQERDMRELEQRGELTRSQLMDILDITRTPIGERFDILAEKGKNGLIRKRRRQDVSCYQLTPKGERTAEFWTKTLRKALKEVYPEPTELIQYVSPKLSEVIRIGEKYNKEELNQSFYIGWNAGREGPYSKETFESIIEDYTELETYKKHQKKLRTGELASIVNYLEPTPNITFRIGELVQEHLPWSLNKIEDKLTRELEEFSDQEEPPEEAGTNFVELDAEPF